MQVLSAEGECLCVLTVLFKPRHKLKLAESFLQSDGWMVGCSMLIYIYVRTCVEVSLARVTVLSRVSSTYITHSRRQ